MQAAVHKKITRQCRANYITEYADARTIIGASWHPHELFSHLLDRTSHV
jgi:hypothetical protein